MYNHNRISSLDGSGRRARLRVLCPKGRIGSSPIVSTKPSGVGSVAVTLRIVSPSSPVQIWSFSPTSGLSDLYNRGMTERERFIGSPEEWEWLEQRYCPDGLREDWSDDDDRILYPDEEPEVDEE